MLAAIGEIYMGVRNITVQIQRQPNIEPCYRLFGDVFEDKGGKYLGRFAVGKDIAFRQLDRAIFQYKGVIGILYHAQRTEPILSLAHYIFL